MAYVEVVLLPALLHTAAEMDLHLVLGHTDLPGVPAHIVEPGVRRLHLGIVDDALAEEAVFIADAAAHGRIVQRGEGIEEAARQAAQTAVAQAGIGLHVLQLVDGQAQVGEDLPVYLCLVEVEKVV